MMRAARLGYLLALSFWTGGLATISFVVAPAAFSTAPSRHVAGDLVGATLRSFARIEVLLGVLGLGAALLMYARRPEGSRRGFVRSILVFVMLVLSLSNLLWIYPEAAVTRFKMDHASAPDAITQGHFAMIHGISVAVVTANILIGVGLLVCAGLARSDDA